MAAVCVALVLLVLLVILPTALIDVTDAQTDVPLKYRILEEVQRGTVIADLMKDVGLYRKYQPTEIQQLDFRIVAQVPVPVVVGSKTGLLSTNGPLDRDSLVQCRHKDLCEVTLDVAIRPAQFFRIVKLTIEIVDVNDNPPRFREQQAVVGIRESASAGSSFSLPVATDADSPVFGVRRYELSPRHMAFGLSQARRRDGSLEPKIVVEQPLDRESRDQYTVQLIAYDGGIPAKSSTVDVIINVLDSNDNTPVFESQSYTVNVTENTPVGTTILQVRATDEDIGPNGQVTFRFSPQSLTAYGHLFAMNNQTGEISIRGEIDYEKFSVHQLSVIAQDLGPDSVPVDAAVVIRVVDVNDNAPSVVINTIPAGQTGTATAEVLENLPIGSFVAHVSVVDLDLGVNGQVSCNISDQAFGLIERYPTEYQVITAEQLDRETRLEYLVVIACWDLGTPTLLTRKNLLVRVLDGNDNRPTFTVSTYTASIIENNFIGANVLQVIARDVDSGPNAKFSYRLSPAVAGIFDVDQSGLVTAKTSIDRERFSSFSFTVVAIDQGSPSLTGTALIVVTVDDVNDERPTFSQTEYSFSLPENDPEGSTVGTVSAEDRDTSPTNRIFYSLVQAHEVIDVVPFNIDSNSGLIRTATVLDREQQSLYVLTITANDQGQPSLTSTVTVNVYVEDRNDNNPVFEYPTVSNDTVHVSNLAPPGHPIVRLVATDRDIDRNGRITYRIREGNTNGTFSVDPEKGNVLVGRRGFGRSEYAEYRLRVAAEDEGSPVRRSAEAILRVIVNSSIVFGEAGSNMDARGIDLASNLVLVVALVGASAIVTLVLLLLIAALRQHGRKRRLQRQKCRMEMLKALTAKDGLQDGRCCGSPSTSCSSNAVVINNGKEEMPMKSSLSVLRNHCPVANGSTIQHTVQVITSRLAASLFVSHSIVCLPCLLSLISNYLVLFLISLLLLYLPTNLLTYIHTYMYLQYIHVGLHAY